MLCIMHVLYLKEYIMKCKQATKMSYNETLNIILQIYDWNIRFG